MPKKILAVIVDSRGGMMFNSRRQVKDAEVIADMIARYGGDGACIAPYSVRLFEGYEGITVDAAPIETAGNGMLVFAEDPSLIKFDGVDTVVIYRYGIRYPADRFFEYDLVSLGYKRISKDKFSTALHQKIEREVYKKGID